MTHNITLFYEREKDIFQRILIFYKREFLVKNSLLPFSEETDIRDVQIFINSKSQSINVFKNVIMLPPK